ncbi:SusD/RagB family nutrient-binding outer membrane lipoprotein [Chitinophaga sp. 22321]|uniref:SusD/RagB family nutrient-binding outer membrane lipoprotein n=1 Tax=Chitinophaga hostae TaxID=2831022 RepID=A0ABS5JCA9_9BACT|nr:SusD/RagB family nutrient-binding outer membrane lipoprotein [Chitinophaga hostae]MBS0032252.1 SusD/RagB family nutrient-binding outer membrane lipoprotein [Chitinophaga hostae]
MKNIQRSIYSLLLCASITGAVSCTKGFEDLNKPYKQADEETASIPGLYNGLVSSLGKYGNDALNVSLLYPITNQQARQNTVAPYINYSGGFWGQYYPDLFNYKALLKKIAEQPTPEAFNNVKYMATILIASKTLRMLDYYGDIPYSQASNARESETYYRPAYDAQADVYKSVLQDLKTAADGISTDPSQINIGASESFLKSNIIAWKKFANALRLRYAVRLYDKERDLSSSIITDILNGNKPLPANQVLASLQDDNFGLWPNLVAGPSGNILESLSSKWDSYRELSISDIRMSSNVWRQMSSSDDPTGADIYDPRCFVYFMTNNQDKWVPQPQDGSVAEGGRPFDNGTERKPIGSDPKNKFATFNYFIAYDRLYYPILIITEADVHFLKAEIYQRGMGVAKNTGLAKTAYEAGIKASVDFWYQYTRQSQIWLQKPALPTAGQMTAFLNNPAVAYDGANQTGALRKIATQAWLATMFQPAESWAIVRRTGLTPKDPNYNPGAVNKLPYPDDENVNNHENWNKVTQGATPTQQVLTKVYWMQ